MNRRLVLLCHLFGWRPCDVMDLTWSQWLGFARFVDSWEEAHRGG